MDKWQKLLDKATNNPGGLRLIEAIALAEHFGFRRRAGGMHPNICKRQGHRTVLNFQDDGTGKAKAYQVKQLLKAIEEIDKE